MSDGGIVTAEVNGFTVTSNSGATPEQVRTNLKAHVDKGASSAGRELGQLGGKASAEKRAEAKEDAKPEPKESVKADDKAQAAVDEAEKRAEAKMAKEAEGEAKPEEAAEGKTEEKPESEEDKKKGNPRHDPRARMLEATRKEAEAKRALAEERAQRSALEARLEALERLARSVQGQSEPRAERDPEEKPSPDGFSTYEEYLDARDDWNRRQWDSQVQKRSQASAYERGLTQAVEKFRSAASSVVEQISPEVAGLRTEFQLAPGEKPTGENWIANELVFSPESAPALMLYFTAHPDDLQRIAALTTPRAVSREMAKLETRLEAATAGNSSEREDAVSKASPPVKPVTGKPYVTESDEYRPGMSLDEYAKIWRKRQNRTR